MTECHAKKEFYGFAEGKLGKLNNMQTENIKQEAFSYILRFLKSCSQNEYLYLLTITTVSTAHYLLFYY